MIDKDALSVIHELVRELSEEIDLHYEDSDFFALGSTISVLRKSADILKENSMEPPSVYRHVVGRYQRSVH